MFCTNCGSQFEDGNAFCPNCGSKIESVAQPVAAPAPAAAPVEAAPVQATPVEAAPIQATPVEAAPVAAIPVAAAAPVEPAPAPAPAPAPVQPTYAQPVAAQPVYSQPVYAAPVAPVATAENAALAKSILIFGIMAVAFACTVWVSAAGIVFGALGLSKAKKFVEECGQLYGKAKIGKYLSLGGLIGSSVITGYMAFYILMAVLSAISNY